MILPSCHLSNPLMSSVSLAHDLMTYLHPFLGNDPICLLLAQLLRTPHVICVQRRIEEIAHVAYDWARGEEHLLCARGVGSGIDGECERAEFDSLQTSERGF